MAIWIIGEPSLNASLKKRDTEPFRMRKRYLRRSTSKIRLVGEVHRHRVAEEPVGLEDIEEQLPVLIPGLVGEHQVDVVVEVAEVFAVPLGRRRLTPSLIASLPRSSAL